MTRTSTLPRGAALVLSLLVTHAARAQTDAPGHQDTTAPAAFAREVDSFTRAHLAYRPYAGVMLGLHEYDGKVPDWSKEAVAAEIVRLTAARTRFETFLPADLDRSATIDREVLLVEIRDQLFELATLRAPFRNPITYTEGALDLTPYISRDYAPLAQRAQAIVALCRATGPFLAAARANLDASVPKPWLETALLQTSGSIESARGDVPAAMNALTDAALKRDVESALAEYATQLASFGEFLKQRLEKGSADFALGVEQFRRMLLETQNVDIDLARLKRIGEDDLARNLKALASACHEIDAEKRLDDVVAAVCADRPPASGLLALATEQCAQAREFVTAHEIVSIPTKDECVARESPPFMRWNAAFEDGAGVFEKATLPSFYYISPPDPTWPKEEQESYLPNRYQLLFTTVHEVWPGHFLQGLHLKVNPSRCQKSFATYSFTEGWAHYAEEMMWQEGLGGGEARMHVGQLLEALLRNVRYVCAIGLHTEGMTVDQATARFAKEAFCDPANARQQAVRGTFDPGYLNYTLGKLMILKLRDDVKAREGTKFTLRSFHDRLLSYGSAPIPVIRRAMLGPDAGPAL